jgi:multicomponent Na+:H+ antiporter subunit D
MLVGVMGAISKYTIKGILSYHIISQIGYMLLAIGFFTPLSIAASLLFAIHNMVVKSSLFLYGGIANIIYETDEINLTGNVWMLAPWAGLLFLCQALSLAGLPPFSGFWGKYLIIWESLALEHYIPAAIAVITSALTLFSMLKIWISVFWGSSKSIKNYHPLQLKRLIWSSSGLTIFALAIGLGFEYALDLASKAATEIFDKDIYIQAVYAAKTFKGDL